MLTLREISALAIALLADVIQIVLFPIFAEGVLSPFDDVLDGVVFIVLWGLLGWHFVLLPTAATELIPGADLAPTWMAAVLFIIWRKRKAAQNASNIISRST